MLRHGQWICVLVYAVTYSASWAEETTKKSVSYGIPGENHAVKAVYIEQDKAAKITVTVTADPGYVLVKSELDKAPEGVTVTGNNPWIISVSASSQGKTYEVYFKGLYRPVGGSGTTQKDLPWDVRTQIVVSNCDNETSGTDPNDIKASVEMIPLAPKMRSVDCDIPGHNMGDVLKAVGHPTAIFNEHTRYLPNWSIRTECKLLCPICNQNTWYKYEYYFPRDVKLQVSYEFELPSWNQLPQAGPLATADWKSFKTALDTHEDGHLDRAKKFWEDNFGDFAKKKYWGKAHALERARHLAYKLRIDAWKRLSTAEKKLQKKYDVQTKYGVKQGAILHANIQCVN
ncbi:MAG: DUF922 domain-containing protein [Planctomycetota bacterium]